MAKTCDGCKSERSKEWSLSVELAKSNRRMFVILLVVICLWAATVAGFLVYLNRYDYSSYEVTQDGEGFNNYNENGTHRDVIYGAENQEESQN